MKSLISVFQEIFASTNKILISKSQKINQKVPKYYEHDWLQNFLLFFISLSTTLIAKNSHILAGIYFIFLKKLS